MASYNNNYKNTREIPPERHNGPFMITSDENAALFNTGNITIEETTLDYGKDISIDAAKGVYGTIFLMSDEINEEKIDLFKAFGSDIVILPSSDLPESYHDKIERIEIDIPSAVPGSMIC